MTQRTYQELSMTCCRWLGVAFFQRLTGPTLVRQFFTVLISLRPWWASQANWWIRSLIIPVLILILVYFWFVGLIHIWSLCSIHQLIRSSIFSSLPRFFFFFGILPDKSSKELHLDVKGMIIILFIFVSVLFFLVEYLTVAFCFWTNCWQCFCQITAIRLHTGTAEPLLFAILSSGSITHVSTHCKMNNIGPTIYCGFFLSPSSSYCCRKSPTFLIKLVYYLAPAISHNLQTGALSRSI